MVGGLDVVCLDQPVGTHPVQEIDAPPATTGGHCALCHWMVNARAANGAAISVIVAPADQRVPALRLAILLPARSLDTQIPSRAPPA